jgi:ABC-type branched-subunit amino acid transport system substrate-binding protein
MKNRTLRTCLAIATVALATAAEAQAPGVTSSTVVVGQSAAFTGPAAQLGIQMRDGMKAYFDLVNSQGGINGRKIQLVTRDDQYESKLAADNTKKLIDEDRVFALIGYVGTPTSAASLPIFTEARVPFIGPFTGAELLRNPFNRYVFNVRASYFDETDKIVEQLLTVGMKRFAVFYQNDAYGQAGLAGMERAVKARGGEIVTKATVERNTVEVAKAAADIGAKAPDAVVMISAYKSITAFVRAMKKNGYTGQFHNVSFVGSKALSEELGADGQGVVISQVVPFPWSQSTPVVREFTDIAAKSKADVNFSSMEGYLVAKVFAEGLRRAGKTPTRENLVTALESMRDVDFGGFNVNFSASNHNASRFVDLTIIGRGGKFLH